MNNKDFTVSFSVNEKPGKVYETLLNVRSWWSGLFGEHIRDEEDGGFTFQAGEGAHYSRQKPVEMIPGRNVMWLVTDSKLTFIKEQEEWTSTKIGFELTPDKEGTRVTFTHLGLTPSIECFEECSSAWNRYLQERLIPLFDEPVAKFNH